MNVSLQKREQEVLLFCPKLPNERHPKPLLVIAQNKSDKQNTQSTSCTSECAKQLIDAWQMLMQTMRLNFLAALETQPLYKKLEQANDDTICEVLNSSVVTNPKGLNLKTPIDALRWLTFQYQQRNRLPSKLYAIGFKRFWRPTIEAFCQGSTLIHVKHAEQVPADATAITWGLKPLKTQDNVEVIRLEDGFLRSVGLGIQFARPLSWIPDRRGMYFDATRPSDLEYLLNTMAFHDAEIQEAKKLRELIVSKGITKYNTGSKQWQLPQSAEGKRIILVPGQVESDASIHFGAPDIKTNAELVSAVRAANPDAFIIYKPHPDVVSKSRAVGSTEQDAHKIADCTVTEVNIEQVISQVQEVHVLTSLAGFEALLRGKAVTTYGVPFFAGWGLTLDKCEGEVAKRAFERRHRRHTIDTLVAAAINTYPLYVSREHGYYSNAIHTLAELERWREEPQGLQSIFKIFIRKAMNAVFGAK